MPIDNLQPPEPSTKAFVAMLPSEANSPLAIARELMSMRARLTKEDLRNLHHSHPMGFFESILFHTDKPVAVLKDGVHVFVNPRYAAFMGQEEKDLIGIRLEHLLEDSCRLTLWKLLSALNEACTEVDFLARVAGEAPDYPKWHWHLARFSQGNTAYVRVEPSAHKSPSINSPSTV